MKKKEKIKYYWEKDNDFFEDASELNSISENVSETDKDIVIRIHLLGFKKEEINLNVKEDRIEIHAAKKEKKIEKSETSFRQEISSSSFSKAFTLPYKVNPEEIETSFEDGILTVAMKKKEKKKLTKKEK